MNLDSLMVRIIANPDLAPLPADAKERVQFALDGPSLYFDRNYSSQAAKLTRYVMRLPLETQVFFMFVGVHKHKESFTALPAFSTLAYQSELKDLVL